MFNIGLVVLWQHAVLTVATFRCWSRIKFLGLKQETDKHGKPWVAPPPMEGANGPVQMQRYSKDIPVSSLSSGSSKGATMVTLGGKGKTGRCGEIGGVGRKS